VAWPLAVARAQQAGRLPIIGYMALPVSSPTTAAFVERLRELGWIDGHTVTIMFRWAEGRTDRVSEIATEFAQQKVDVIVAYGGAVTAINTAIKQTAPTTPIIFAPAADPVSTGLVASLARPGGNVTGLSLQATDTASKRLEQLRAVVPRLRRLAIMFDAGYPASVVENDEVQVVARTLGLEVASHRIRRAEDIAPVFEVLKGHADALYVAENNLIFANHAQIIRLALDAQLPTTFITGDVARAGGLMSYGPNFPTMFRRAAEIVDKILRGTKPGDIPVDQPIKFDLIINLKTAKALGLDVPSHLQQLADEVIE